MRVREIGGYMNTESINRSVLNCEHQWIRSLIKRYNTTTDPIEKQELMVKMEEAKAKIDRIQLSITCG
jgi:hypothetical protein